MNIADAPFKESRFPSSAMRVETRSDGSTLVEPVVELEPFTPSIPAELAQAARALPDKTYLAQRATRGAPWSRHSYRETKRDAHAIALERRVESGRSVLILSGNSIAHAIVKFGAMTGSFQPAPVDAPSGRGPERTGDDRASDCENKLKVEHPQASTRPR